MRFKALRDIWRAQYIVSASLSFFPSLFYFLPCKSSQNKKRKTHHKRCHLAGGYFTTTRAAITTDDAVGVRQCVLGIFISIVSFAPVSIFTQYECLAHWVLNEKYVLKDMCEALTLLSLCLPLLPWFQQHLLSTSQCFQRNFKLLNRTHVTPSDAY